MAKITLWSAMKNLGLLEGWNLESDTSYINIIPSTLFPYCELSGAGYGAGYKAGDPRPTVF